MRNQSPDAGAAPSDSDLKCGTIGRQGSKEFGIIIPARFGASRLPGKPLRTICGRPLIAHVYENALRAGADFTLVATDDPRIAEVVSAMGGDVELTSSTHVSGTERLAEVVQKRGIEGDKIIVNIQGDEPLLSPMLIRVVAASLSERATASLATLASPISLAKDVFDPNVVKVVLDHDGYALYFSRAPIPWSRDTYPMAPDVALTQSNSPEVLRHWGIYAYRAKTLLELLGLPQCPNESVESLEQLRALHWGLRIHVSVVDSGPARGVDTEEDLRFVERVLASRAKSGCSSSLESESSTD